MIKDLDKVVRYNELSDTQKEIIHTMAEYIVVNKILADTVNEIAFFNCKNEYNPVFFFKTPRRDATFHWYEGKYHVDSHVCGDAEFNDIADAIKHIYEILSSEKYADKDISKSISTFGENVINNVCQLINELRGIGLISHTVSDIILYGFIEFAAHHSIIAGDSKEKFMKIAGERFNLMEEYIGKSKGGINLQDLVSMISKNQMGNN